MQRRYWLMLAGSGLLGLGLARCGGSLAEAPASLQVLAARRGLLWGAATDTGQIREPEFRRLLLRQVGLLVPEWEMKWDQLQPEPGQFRFGAADALLRFAREHQLAMRGHTLLWHQQLPAWVGRTLPDQVEAVLERYVRTVVEYYRGQLHSWDVVNEPIAEDGSGLRRTLWLEHLGPDYIARALHWARASDRSTPLVINEYGLEGDDPTTARKREQMLTLLRSLRRQGAPVQALGLQAHLYATPAGPTFRTLPTFLRQVSDLGLDLYITELDVNDQALPAAIPERDARVAAVYSDFLAAVLPQPHLKLICGWGLSDRHTWLNQAFPRRDGLPQRPLPFDRDLQPKAALLKIVSNLMT